MQEQTHYVPRLIQKFILRLFVFFTNVQRLKDIVQYIKIYCDKITRIKPLKTVDMMYFSKQQRGETS